VRVRDTAVGCVLALLLGSCGGDDAADSGGSKPELAADLTVTVRPEGPDGAARRRTIECERLGPKAGDATCRKLAGLTAAQLEPVPAGTACTQIYGGPAVARVRGELRGKRVDASFELTNGCEIERWDRNRVLLRDAPARN
jgi:hypothetical protein